MDLFGFYCKWTPWVKLLGMRHICFWAHISYIVFIKVEPPPPISSLVFNSLAIHSVEQNSYNSSKILSQLSYAYDLSNITLNFLELVSKSFQKGHALNQLMFLSYLCVCEMKFILFLIWFLSTNLIQSKRSML